MSQENPEPRTQKPTISKITRAIDGLRPTRHALSTVRHNSAKGIDNILLEMKLENKSDYTINFTRKALNTISKYADLANRKK